MLIKILANSFRLGKEKKQLEFTLMELLSSKSNGCNCLLFLYILHFKCLTKESLVSSEPSEVTRKKRLPIWGWFPSHTCCLLIMQCLYMLCNSGHTAWNLFFWFKYKAIFKNKEKKQKHLEKQISNVSEFSLADNILKWVCSPTACMGMWLLWDRLKSSNTPNESLVFVLFATCSFSNRDCFNPVHFAWFPLTRYYTLCLSSLRCSLSSQLACPLLCCP